MRVGTPAGLSNPLFIGPATPPAAASGFAFAPTFLPATLVQTDGKLVLQFGGPLGDITLSDKSKSPAPAGGVNPEVFGQATAAKADGTAISFKSSDAFSIAPATSTDGKTITIKQSDFNMAMNTLVQSASQPYDNQPFDITLTGQVIVYNWPPQQTTNSIVIHVTRFCPQAPSAETVPTPPAKTGPDGMRSGGLRPVLPTNPSPDAGPAIPPNPEPPAMLPEGTVRPVGPPSKSSLSFPPTNDGQTNAAIWNTSPGRRTPYPAKQAVGGLQYPGS